MVSFRKKLDRLVKVLSIDSKLLTIIPTACLSRGQGFLRNKVLLSQLRFIAHIVFRGFNCTRFSIKRVRAFLGPLSPLSLPRTRIIVLIRKLVPRLVPRLDAP